LALACGKPDRQPEKVIEAAAKTGVTSRLTFAERRAVGIAAAAINRSDNSNARICARPVLACHRGTSAMRFILGVIVGAVLMLGSAYLHDTGRLQVGPAQPFVNWDTVIGLWSR
jgi:hypothetical protein